MADSFTALLVSKQEDRQSVALTELTDAPLMNGEVTVAGCYSLARECPLWVIRGHGGLHEETSALLLKSDIRRRR
jgi:hypothetical protein